jgi:hypothetical protein
MRIALISDTDFIQRVNALIDYDSASGKMTWKTKSNNRLKAGQEVGVIKERGYRQFQLDKKRYYVHRVAFYIMVGRWPHFHIDHINGDPSDNRWCNLREATVSQNRMNSARQSNNKSGHTGVFWNSQKNKWCAVVKVNYYTTNLGFFSNLEDAVAARDAHASKVFGEFYAKNRTDVR